MRSTDPPTPAEADELAAEHREDLLRNALSHIALNAIPCRVCGAVHVAWSDTDDPHFYSPLTAATYAKATLAQLDDRAAMSTDGDVRSDVREGR